MIHLLINVKSSRQLRVFVSFWSFFGKVDTSLIFPALSSPHQGVLGKPWKTENVIVIIFIKKMKKISFHYFGHFDNCHNFARLSSFFEILTQLCFFVFGLEPTKLLKVIIIKTIFVIVIIIKPIIFRIISRPLASSSWDGLELPCIQTLPG